MACHQRMCSFRSMRLRPASLEKRSPLSAFPISKLDQLLGFSGPTPFVACLSPEFSSSASDASCTGWGARRLPDSWVGSLSRFAFFSRPASTRLLARAARRSSPPPSSPPSLSAPGRPTVGSVDAIRRPTPRIRAVLARTPALYHRHCSGW